MMAWKKRGGRWKLAWLVTRCKGCTIRFFSPCWRWQFLWINECNQYGSVDSWWASRSGRSVAPRIVSALFLVYPWLGTSQQTIFGSLVGEISPEAVRPYGHAATPGLPLFGSHPTSNRWPGQKSEASLCGLRSGRLAWGPNCWTQKCGCTRDQVWMKWNWWIAGVNTSDS